MDEEQLDHVEDAPEPETAPPSRLTTRLQLLVLLGGLFAAGWLAYRALAPKDCGCSRDRTSTSDARVGSLISDFSVPVLVYERAEGQDAASFARQVGDHATALRTAGYSFLTAGQVADAALKGERLPAHAVAITVDSDDADVLKAVADTLAGLHVPASAFVRPDRIGGAEALTWEEAGKLAKMGIELHCRLEVGEENADDLGERARRAVELLKEKLEPGSNVTLAVVSPSGPRTPKVDAAMLKERADVAAVWTEDQTAVTPVSNGPALPRARIRPATPVQAFLRKVMDLRAEGVSRSGAVKAPPSKQDG